MEDKLLEWADKVEELVDQFAEPTTELILATAQVAAAQIVVSGIGLLIFALVFAYGMYWVWKYSMRDELAGEDGEVGYKILAIILAVIALLFFIKALGALLNIAAWVGLFHPEVFIAYRVLGL